MVPRVCRQIRPGTESEQNQNTYTCSGYVRQYPRASNGDLLGVKCEGESKKRKEYRQLTTEAFDRLSEYDLGKALLALARLQVSDNGATSDEQGYREEGTGQAPHP